jgi:hypothetical protein
VQKESPSPHPQKRGGGAFPVVQACRSLHPRFRSPPDGHSGASGRHSRARGGTWRSPCGAAEPAAARGGARAGTQRSARPSSRRREEDPAAVRRGVRPPTKEARGRDQRRDAFQIPILLLLVGPRRPSTLLCFLCFTLPIQSSRDGLGWIGWRPPPSPIPHVQ